MDIEDLIIRVRDHYVEQLRLFVAQQKEACGGLGSAEVKLQIPEPSSLYRGLFCIDFAAKVGEETIFREMQADSFLAFAPVAATIGSAEVVLANLHWNDVIIYHDLGADIVGLDAWFEAWLDPQDARYDEAAEFALCIHSLGIEPGVLTVDFGTAPPDAFWHLMKALTDAGARRFEVDCTPEAEVSV